MLKLTYVTSNDGKFAEASRLLPGLERLKMELPEIQTLDHKVLIEAKLEAARLMIPDAKERIIIVEDGANFFEGFGKTSRLPGTLAKHFLDELTPEEMYRLAQTFNVTRGRIELMVGVLIAGERKEYFVGEVFGQIVAPRKDSKMRFDVIFQPDGGTKTCAEMTPEEKNAISHRGIALRKVREYLKNI